MNSKDKEVKQGDKQREYQTGQQSGYRKDQSSINQQSDLGGAGGAAKGSRQGRQDSAIEDAPELRRKEQTKPNRP